MGERRPISRMASSITLATIRAGPAGIENLGGLRSNAELIADNSVLVDADNLPQERDGLSFKGGHYLFRMEDVISLALGGGATAQPASRHYTPALRQAPGHGVRLVHISLTRQRQSSLDERGGKVNSLLKHSIDHLAHSHRVSLLFDFKQHTYRSGHP